jgi:hypothetical protein
MKFLCDGGKVCFSLVQAPGDCTEVLVTVDPECWLAHKIVQFLVDSHGFKLVDETDGKKLLSKVVYDGVLEYVVQLWLTIGRMFRISGYELLRA